MRTRRRPATQQPANPYLLIRNSLPKIQDKMAKIDPSSFSKLSAYDRRALGNYVAMLIESLQEWAEVIDDQDAD